MVSPSCPSGGHARNNAKPEGQSCEERRPSFQSGQVGTAGFGDVHEKRQQDCLKLAGLFGFRVPACSEKSADPPRALKSINVCSHDYDIPKHLAP